MKLKNIIISYLFTIVSLFLVMYWGGERVVSIVTLNTYVFMRYDRYYEVDDKKGDVIKIIGDDQYHYIGFNKEINSYYKYSQFKN